MRNQKRLSSFFRCLALCCALLFLGAGCGQTGGKTTEITEPTEEPMQFLCVEKGTAYYSFAVDSRAETLCRDAVQKINAAVEALYGTPLNGTAHKITLVADGDRKNYSVTLDEATGDFTVTGGNQTALERALYGFFAAVLQGNEKEKVYLDASLCVNYDSALDSIDNSALLSYIPSDQVTLTAGNDTGTVQSPDWIEDLVMVELRPDMASIGGTLPEAKPLVDFYAAAGVNGFWLCPIYKRDGGNGYGNVGPHLFEPAITGSEDQAQGLRNIREFVDYAHQKGIYVFLDVITWGVQHNSELTALHPDWFSGEAWGGAAYNWSNKELQEWFIATIVNNVLQTDADGLRCDCEPFTSGYYVYGEIRDRLAAQGKYIVIISEEGSTRASAYDMEQDGVLKYADMTRQYYYEHPVNFFVDGYLDLVDSVKNGTGLGISSFQANSEKAGTGRYYTNCITNHDFVARNVKGNRLKIGYAAILAPYIPLWYMGDEFNVNNRDGVQYFNKVNYAEAQQEDNYFFLEDVKKYIAIRRTYGEIYSEWPENHRDTAICAVKTEGLGDLTAYARYTEDKAILVIPNKNASGVGGKVTVPFADCGFSPADTFRVTDLLSGRVIAEGRGEDIAELQVLIRFLYVGVYLVERV